MEIVNTLDIDGTQWEIQDAEARQDIAKLKLSCGDGFKNVQIVSSLGSDNLKEVIRSQFPKLENAKGMIKIDDGTTLYCGTYIKYSNSQGSVTFTSIEGISYIWTIQGNTVTLQELATMDKVMDLGRRENLVTFPFKPTVNGTLLITILQKNSDPIARDLIIMEDGESYYYINNYFAGSWGAYSTNLPLLKGKTYTVVDSEDVIMYEKTKFIY